MVALILMAMAPAPAPVSCLVQAYPQVEKATATELVFVDGTRMPLRTRKAEPKDFAERLAKADLLDQVSQVYPRGAAWPKPPALNADPGRLRSDAFFRKIYGDSKKAVAAKTTTITWLPGIADVKLKVSTVNGVHEKLQKVSAELAKLPPEVRKYVEKPSGTFVWRTIKGTERLSMHSFALAIDVGVGFSDYWKWVRPDKEGRYPYRNRFPWAVVEIFERHGFIWGGKWYHFDTMHFEYRPELLIAPCVQDF